MIKSTRLLQFVLLLFAVQATTFIHAQQKLATVVSLNADQQPVKQLLQQLAEQGHFYFSYESTILREDSLVTIHVQKKTILQVLQILFGDQYQYVVSGNYIIIKNKYEEDYIVSGYVYDAKTHEALSDVSVYEKKQLVSTFSNAEGYYKLKLKYREEKAVIGISRVAYQDSSMIILPGKDQLLNVQLQPFNNELDEVVINANRTTSSAGNMLLSARQKMRSRNLRNFLTKRPVQFSIIPGLSTTGKLNSQVINNLSVNLLGGYTAGVNGIEVGGLFNINQKNVRYLQVAGVLNTAGGSATGLQLSVGHNLVTDTLRGMQLSIYANKTQGMAKGAQVAVLYNYAKHLKGLQIGLINASDSSDGVSIGLLNFVRGGYRRVAFYTGDLMNANIAYKSGNKILYSIVIAGSNISGSAKMHAIGVGLGHEFRFGKWIGLSTEANVQLIRLMSWDNHLFQAKADLNVRVSNKLYLFGGAVYNRYNNYDAPQRGYKSIVTPEQYYAAAARFENAKRNWLGWEAGIMLDAGTNSKPERRTESGWQLGINAGIGVIDYPVYLVKTTEVRLQKDFLNNISATLSAGYTHFPLNKYSPGDPDYKAIPLKAGIKVFTIGRFYISGEGGYGIGLAKNKNASVLAFGAGLELKNGLEIALKYEAHNIPTVQQAGLRVGYNFKLR